MARHIEVVSSTREVHAVVNHDIGYAIVQDSAVVTLRCTRCGDEKTFKGLVGMIEQAMFEDDHEHPVVEPPELDFCSACHEHATFTRAADGSLESDCCNAHPVQVD